MHKTQSMKFFLSSLLWVAVNCCLEVFCHTQNLSTIRGEMNRPWVVWTPLFFLYLCITIGITLASWIPLPLFLLISFPSPFYRYCRIMFEVVNSSSRNSCACKCVVKFVVSASLCVWVTVVMEWELWFCFCVAVWDVNDDDLIFLS